ncbi:MAG: hypothetical protein K6D94_10800, partial [Clostridiales bacterium]|nr:hypothetical protein [Clostridiales bacterium]
ETTADPASETVVSEDEPVMPEMADDQTVLHETALSDEETESAEENSHADGTAVAAETDFSEETVSFEEETTLADEETNAAAEETTAADEETTTASEEPETVVEETTTADEETTIAVEETTAYIEETTAAVEETMAAAEETTAPEEETTSADEEMAAEDTTSADETTAPEETAGPEETEEPEEPGSPVPVSMPPMDYEDSILTGGTVITIIASADEGALPEGTEMLLAAVSEETVREAVESAVRSGADKWKAPYAAALIRYTPLISALSPADRPLSP